MAEAAFDSQAWLRRIGPAALLYARQVTGNLADAEDAVHEGFVRFWRRRESVREREAFLFTCVRSAALDERRGRARRRKREEVLGEARPLFAAGGEEELARREVAERGLAALSREQREVVVLKIWGGLTFLQIAEMLAESPNTVAGRYRQAMEKLAAVMKPEMNHER